MPHKTPVPISTLLTMLSYKRPHESLSEQVFITRYIDSIPGIQTDNFGNKFIAIGANPTTLFCAHIDTVHRAGGQQTVNVDANTNIAFKDDGVCLGADDAAGMWVLMNMIAAEKPGLYVFHRGEECGLLGSKWIVKNNPDFLKGIQHAVAFDRRSTGSIITHQCSVRCCSETFSKALSAQLSMGHTSDDTGSFTDTASYMEHIPECTNVSVGYMNEHSGRETQDLTYVQNLATACIRADWTTLPAERDHLIVEPKYGGYRAPRRVDVAALPMPPKPVTTPSEDKDPDFSNYLTYAEAFDFALRHPHAAADFMVEALITHDDVEDAVEFFGMYGGMGTH